MLALRSFLFLTGYVLLVLVWSILSLVVGAFLPYQQRFQFIIVAWVRMVLFWLFLSCNIRIQVKGLEHIGAGPFVVLSKHESSLETFYLQLILAPIVTIIKRELLYIPFFGWAYALLKPISINRGATRAALKEINKQGLKHLQRGHSVLIFPEGTRLAPGQLGPFYRSGPALAVFAKVPVLPIIHNSGHCWRANQWLKHPGLVEFVIGPPISTISKTSKVVTEEARNWMQTELTKMNWLQSEEPPQNR